MAFYRIRQPITNRNSCNNMFSLQLISTDLCLVIRHITKLLYGPDTSMDSYSEYHIHGNSFLDWPGFVEPPRVYCNGESSTSQQLASGISSTHIPSLPPHVSNSPVFRLNAKGSEVLSCTNHLTLSHRVNHFSCVSIIIIHCQQQNGTIYLSVPQCPRKDCEG
jgi:hypothetical protein